LNDSGHTFSLVGGNTVCGLIKLFLYQETHGKNTFVGSKPVGGIMQGYPADGHSLETQHGPVCL